MALLAKVGSFNVTTQAAGINVPVTGVGFQPKVAIFWWSGRTETVDTIGRLTHRRGVGCAVSSTDRRSVAGKSQDAISFANTTKVLRNSACINTLSGTADSIDGLMDFVSMDADGFTLVIDDAFSTDIRVSYLALGGADLTNYVTGSFVKQAGVGNQDVTTLGFQPDFVMFLGNRQLQSGENAPAVDSQFMIGMATGPNNEAVWSGGSNDGADTMNTASYCLDLECIAFLSDPMGAPVSRAEFVQFLSNGFRVNWLENDAAADIIYFLALKGGNHRVGNFLTSTVLDQDIVISGLGFQPRAAVCVSHCKAKSTQDLEQAGDEWSMGAFDSVTSRNAQATNDVDAEANSLVSTAIEFDEVYINIDNGATPAIEGLVDIQSIDSDGFTLNQDDADPTANFAFYWAMGDTPAGGGPSPGLRTQALLGVGI